MSKPIEHQAFITACEGLANEINTSVQLEPLITSDKKFLGTQIEIEALWYNVPSNLIKIIM
jgi:hypothetical protein